MKFESTKLFRDQFSSETTFNKFLSNFEKWKTGDEHSSYFFGKNSGYVLPKLSNGYLRHVHLVPITNESRKVWEKSFIHKSVKTSDRALIYVERGNNEFLLIYILNSNAHQIAKMATEQDKKLMLGLAKAAENFLDYNKISI